MHDDAARMSPMNDASIVRARRTADGHLEQILPDGSTRPLEGQTDWAYLDAMTDEEAYQHALDDPDNPPLTPERLATMRRVPDPRRLRLSMNLTQEEFARQFEIALGTLRDWEQRSRLPDSTAKAYLRVIARDPDAVRRALGTGPAELPMEHVSERAKSA
jgi:putative transcriptional regulator